MLPAQGKGNGEARLEGRGKAMATSFDCSAVSYVLKMFIE